MSGHDIDVASKVDERRSMGKAGLLNGNRGARANKSPEGIKPNAPFTGFDSRLAVGARRQPGRSKKGEPEI